MKLSNLSNAEPFICIQSQLYPHIAAACADGRPISPREASPPVSSRAAAALQLVKTTDGASNTSAAAAEAAAAAAGVSREQKAVNDDAVYLTPFDWAARVCDIVIDGLQVSL